MTDASSQLSQRTPYNRLINSHEAQAKATLATKSALRSVARILWIQPPDLMGAHRKGLAQRIVRDLAFRATAWVLIVLLAGFFVLIKGAPADNLTQVFGVIFTKEIWFTGLCIYTILTITACRYTINGSTHRQYKINIVITYAWSILLVFITLWWIIGMWTLLRLSGPQPPGIFILSRQTFFFLTVTGHALAVILLAPSISTILGVLVIGLFIPLRMYASEIFSPATVHVAEVWNSAQLIALLVVGVFVALDYVSSTLREITLSIQYEKAQAERKRADRFVSVLSHDLRQPLATLALKLDLMLSRNRSSHENNENVMVQRRDLEQLVEQTEAIETMVNGILDLSRIRAGTWELNPREVALPLAVNKVAAALRSDAEAKRVELEVQTIPYSVRTDPLAFELMLRNLVGNAIRYTPASTSDKRGKVSVSAKLVGDNVEVSVSDNGIGIPADRMDDIFKEYVQIGNTERDRNKGLGLGLSIVAELAKRLHHEIRPASTSGVGTTFTLIIPALGRIPEELLDQKPVAAPPIGELEGMVVLLIDDDERPREALRDQLVDWGCYVLDGESAEAVIEELQTGDVPSQPKAILSDYRLREGKTGLEAIAVLQNALNQPVPAAIWTAETASESLQKIEQSGILRLSKPPSKDALRRFLVTAALVA
jgi:signal transduction histidine kinase/CheY-like chemotaxis protein